MKLHFINKKYLPSKKFIIIMSAILVIGIFLLFFTFSKGESFATGEIKNNSTLKTENETINDLIQKDSDGDGIPDWEEALWGTDKYNSRTFDMPDSDYIENKKKELNIEQNVNVTKLTETEKFAREFFSGFTAMTTSGEVDQETINSFSNALGQKIVNPALIDQYQETDIQIDISDAGDNSSQKAKYYIEMGILFNKYKESGLGDELEVLGEEVASTTGSGNRSGRLSEIATAYQNFSRDLMGKTVPASLAVYHLKIANSSNNTGISVANMGEINADPIVGISGLAQYQKYSEDLIKAVEELEKFLAEEL